jgi:hypothetical protein
MSSSDGRADLTAQIFIRRNITAFPLVPQEKIKPARTIAFLFDDRPFINHGRNPKRNWRSIKTLDGISRLIGKQIHVPGLNSTTGQKNRECRKNKCGVWNCHCY